MNTKLKKYLLSFAMMMPFVVHADPPPWAPAHGYRNKHDHHYKDKYKHHHHRDYYREHDYDRYRHRTYYYDAPDYYQRADNSVLSGTCNRDLIGGMIGGAAGGYIGSNIGKGDGRLAATAAGALLGYVIGHDIGRNMDQVDVRCTGYALEVVPDQQQVAWNNPNNGNHYSVIPTNTYQRDNGRYCREYQSNSIINGRSERVYGTACRNPDGSWQIVE